MKECSIVTASYESAVMSLPIGVLAQPGWTTPGLAVDLCGNNSAIPCGNKQTTLPRV